MSKKKSKLFMSLVALAFCVGIMCFGVYAATSVSYTLSGHISYEVNDVFVDIETRHYISQASTLGEAQSESAKMMAAIATSLESGTTPTGGVTELASDYDKQSTLNNVGGEELPLTGPELNITYGAYSNISGQEKAYVHYIAILVTNYADEEINAILDLDSLYDLTGSNSAIYPYRTMENIPAKSGEKKGVMSYVFALALDEPSQSVNVDFSGVSLSVTRGNLDQYATDGVVYEHVDSNGGYYIVKDYTGDKKRVIVASEYNDGEHGLKPVSGTYSDYYPHDYGFANTDVNEVYLPSSITSIGGTTFAYCHDLRFVAIPKEVTRIGSYAFYYSGIKSIEIPNKVTNIDYNAFQNCSNLKSINFEDNSLLSSIGQSAFSGVGLSSIIIPSSVTSIGSGVFNYCNNLNTVYIDSQNIVTTLTSSSSAGYLIYYLQSGTGCVYINENITNIPNNYLNSTNFEIATEAVNGYICYRKK